MITIKKRICIEDFLNKAYPIVRLGINKKLLDQNGCPIPEIPINAEDYVNENEKYNNNKVKNENGNYKDEKNTDNSTPINLIRNQNMQDVPEPIINEEIYSDNISNNMFFSI